VIVPFYHNQKIVGYTGRKVNDGKPKYLTESQPGYIFNIDRQDFQKKYVIVVEGQFDAIAIDGVAIMTNSPSQGQIAKINSLGKEVICVPDRDSAGSELLNSAIAQRWSASLPPWQEHIKDVADAVKYYGRLYTLSTILHYRVHGEIKIQMIKNKLRSNNDKK
jgi:DNA primase